jgi:hypothetical protein
MVLLPLNGGVMRVASLLVVLAVARTAQSPDRPAVYTAEQAEAGRREVKANSFGACTDCHTTNLTGRNGDAGELPPLGSLKKDYQDLINNNGGFVPPLVGSKFLSRWAARNTKDLSKEFEERFSPPLTEQTRLNLIAYMLQTSGAVPGSQPLTMSTEVPIRSLVPAAPSVTTP